MQLQVDPFSSVCKLTWIFHIDHSYPGGWLIEHILCVQLIEKTMTDWRPVCRSWNSPNQVWTHVLLWFVVNAMFNRTRCHFMVYSHIRRPYIPRDVTFIREIVCTDTESLLSPTASITYLKSNSLSLGIISSWLHQSILRIIWIHSCTQVSFILPKIPKYSGLHHPRFSPADISTALSNKK